MQDRAQWAGRDALSQEDVEDSQAQEEVWKPAVRSRRQKNIFSNIANLGNLGPIQVQFLIRHDVRLKQCKFVWTDDDGGLMV